MAGSETWTLPLAQRITAHLARAGSGANAHCNACNHGDVRPEPYFYVWRGIHYGIHRCARCTHQFVDPPVTAEEQALIYSDDYFSEGGDWACGCYDGSYAEAEPRLRVEAAKVLAMLPEPPGRLLDVGCAGGTFLDSAGTHGFDVAGIELNAAMAQHARSRYGLDVLNSRIEEVPADEWSAAFDVVTLLDVLEHVPEPLAALRTIARWVRPGGHVLIRGPLSNSRTAHLKEGVRRSLWLTKRLPGYPLDANMFNRRSLSTLLRSSGFVVEAWIGMTHSFANVLARRAGQHQH